MMAISFRTERLVGSTRGARTPNLRPGFAENHEIITRRLSAIFGMCAAGAIPINSQSHQPLALNCGVDLNSGSKTCAKVSVSMGFHITYSPTPG